MFFLLLQQAAHEVVALAGFHIKRQEFEPEYDNEAEMIVADMEFKEDDTEVGCPACVLTAFAIHWLRCLLEQMSCLRLCSLCYPWAKRLACMAVLLVSSRSLLSIGQKACVHDSPAGVLTAFAMF